MRVGLFLYVRPYGGGFLAAGTGAAGSKKVSLFRGCGCVAFGVTTAVFRIGQGAHFFSDVAFSALVMCLLIVAVYRRLF